MSIAQLRGRLAAREDTEHVQALIRVGFGLIVAAYLFLTAGPSLGVLVFFVTFTLVALLLFAAIVARPQPSSRRRMIGAMIDIGTTTFVMLKYGEIGSPLYGIYLWVTFGNGFRYGVRPLYTSHIMSLIGFVTVILLNPFWHENLLLTGGLFVLLAALPPYGGVLLKALGKANRNLHEQAMRDVLTGLYNRRYLMDSFDRELRRARRRNECLGVMMIDIDHFKQFNDTYGHAAGDEVLHSVALIMLTLVRGEDILCRFGGEEFVLVQMTASAEALTQRAEELRDAVGSHEIVHRARRLGPVTLSIGIAMFPDHGASAETLLSGADAALYRAKASGRNRVVMLSNDHDSVEAAAS
jgi:diguanylate cyclase (GGDEF)-like protein